MYIYRQSYIYIHDCVYIYVFIDANNFDFDTSYIFLKKVPPLFTPRYRIQDEAIHSRGLESFPEKKTVENPKNTNSVILLVRFSGTKMVQVPCDFCLAFLQVS